MTEETLPEIQVSYALDASNEKEVESVVQVLVHHLLQGNIAVVDCTEVDGEDDVQIPVLAAIVEFDGNQGIIPIASLFTDKDKPSETLVPVATDPRKNV